MLGELNEEEIERVLHREVVGRIGCHLQGRTFVVPVTYAYDGQRVICHSRVGLKVQMLRENPDACFEVEQIRDLTNWRSVIAWGRYEELNGDAAAMAMGLLIERLSPIVASATMPRTPHTAITPHGHLETGEEAVVFCLNLTEKSGRFERNLPGE